MINIANGEDSFKLLKLLKQENRPVGDIVAEFSSCFRPSLHFALCTSLYLIVELTAYLMPVLSCKLMDLFGQDEFLLTAPERLAVFAILNQAYATQLPSTNPFIRFILTAACDEGAEKFERAFILQLLKPSDSSCGKEFLKLSAADYIKSFDPSILDFPFPQIDQLQKQYYNASHSESYSCFFKDVAVKNVVTDPDIPSNCKTSSPEFELQHGSNPKLGSGDKDETVVGLLTNLTLEGLGPQWVRPCPPRLPIQDGELVWLIPDNNHDIIWDDGMCADTSGEAEVRNLIAKATKVALIPAQMEKVVMELATDPRLINRCGMTPLRLPELVEHNPLIAVEVLTRLIDSPKITDYFGVLVTMEMSLHSMEVVNRLTQVVKLPSDFLRVYISSCINSCETTKDKYMQNRLVRLVCVFLQSLIRNNHIDVKEILIEVQTFCINFSRIREAAELFRLLKTMEG